MTLTNSTQNKAGLKQTRLIDSTTDRRINISVKINSLHKENNLSFQPKILLPNANSIYYLEDLKLNLYIRCVTCFIPIEKHI